MIAAGGPQKLRFTVTYCSGEDYDYPVRELLFHSPQTRGWQSPRMCKYPQEILLRLENPSRLTQIQILSHEHKIATKVEVFIGLQNPQDPGFDPTSLKRLGYMSFDSNERSSHQARELKSVSLNINAYVVRFVIHRCHVNKLNIYNQVGLIAVNMIGEPLPPPQQGPPGYLDTNAPPLGPTPYHNHSAANMADINLDLHVDPYTAAKIRDMQKMKEQAIESEDYDEAKRLKVSLERLKVIGQKIMQLETRKRAAVEKEDYDLAKALKVDIEKLRMAGEGAAVGGGEGGGRGPEEALNRAIQKEMLSASTASDTPVAGLIQAGSFAPPPRMSQVASLGDPLDQLASPGGVPSQQDWQTPSAPAAYVPYDERPTNGRGVYDENAGSAMPSTTPKRAANRPTHSDDEQVIDAQAPSDWPPDLPAPERVSGPGAAEATELGELVGEYAASAFASKNWQLRDAAATYLVGVVKEGRLTERREAYRSLVKAAVRGLKDRVPNVFHSSVLLLKEVLDAFAATVQQRDLASAAEQSIPVLLDKIGDANTRIKETAKTAIMDLAGMSEVGLTSMTSLFVRPVKNQSAWKPVLGTLQLLQDLVPAVGVSKSGEGFELGELMDYVGKALNSPNAEVRSAAVKMATTVHGMCGPAVRKMLPKDINPKTKEQLDQAFGEGELAAAPPVAAAAAGGGGKSKTAKQPLQPPPAAVPESVLDDSDPSAYESELRQREKAMGPEHPDVAETCTNLAIIHNQQGNFERAQQLYERALRIYEKAHGRDHPDVAHTLTDLAVLHLEQGRDEVGRPLLQRALAIQERHLGPDHPDVLAIRDVLNSDD